MLTAQQLSETYNNNVLQLITTYNNGIAAILKLRVKNNIKQNNLNALKKQYQANMLKLKLKYMADLAALTKPVPVPVVAPVGNKKALLVGVNYNGTASQLNGCINDALNISTMLSTKYTFPSANIKILTDDTETKPTHDNLLTAFTQLLKSGEAGDLLFFSFSGHGSYILDKNNDETTGYDEMIITADLKGILDDELKALIKTHLKKNVTLFALFDCCFSGTVLDLKYQYLDSLKNNTSTQNNMETETIGNVIMISGCTDEQTSADAYLDKKYQGAMTWAFLASLNSVPAPVSWRELLTNMRTLLAGSKFTQLPQLSSGCLMDINKALCLL
jgi:hypothetical protein